MALQSANAAAAFTADELEAVGQSLYKSMEVGRCLWHCFGRYIEKAFENLFSVLFIRMALRGRELEKEEPMRESLMEISLQCRELEVCPYMGMELVRRLRSHPALLDSLTSQSPALCSDNSPTYLRPSKPNCNAMQPQSN